MKLKQKPTKPERRTELTERLELLSYNNNYILTWDDFKDSVNRVLSLFPDATKVTLELESDGYYESSNDKVILKIIRPETTLEYLERIAQYNEELKKYNEWYEKNKDKVDAIQDKKLKNKIFKNKLKEAEAKLKKEIYG
jgi:hypothetical protein